MWDAQNGPDTGAFPSLLTGEWVAKAVDSVSPMRQLGLFLTAPKSHCLELLPDLVFDGVSFRFLALYHTDEIVGIAGRSYVGRMWLILGIVGGFPLLPCQCSEWCDELFSCRPWGLFELASESRDLMLALARFRIPAGVCSLFGLGFIRLQSFHHVRIELV